MVVEVNLILRAIWIGMLLVINLKEQSANNSTGRRLSRLRPGRLSSSREQRVWRLVVLPDRLVALQTLWIRAVTLTVVL